MDDTGHSNDGLRGRTVWAVTSGVEVIGPLLDGLSDLGASVETGGGAPASQDEADAIIARLAATGGAPALVVLSVLPEEAMRCAPLSEFSPAEWRAAAVDGLRTTMYLLRALGPAMKNGGAIVLVGPTLSLVGCPEMVALTTLLEGQRGMMKCVARQWGSKGITLNWAALSPRGLSPVFDGARLAVKPDAVSIALGQAPDARSQVAPILGFLASPAGRSITGMTLTLDGGEWMVP